MFLDKLLGKKPKKKRHKKRRRKRSAEDAALKARAAELEQFVVEEVELAAPAATIASEAYVPKKRKNTQWKTFVRMTATWMGLWAMLTAATLFGRDAWPDDETRLLGMAWEMWRDGFWQVSMLNGVADWGSPPLMLWITQFLWHITGVNEMAVRLIPPVFAALTAIMTILIARNLWPGRVDIARYVPLTLFGLVFWSLFTSILLADMVLVFFVVMAMWSLTLAGMKKNLLAWPALLAALAAGLMAGGLPILWYVLPVAILAPVWADEEANIKAGAWYGKLLLVVVAALAVSAYWWWQTSGGSVPSWQAWLSSWLLPQTASYFSTSMPWWGYLLLLPIVFLPWSVWPLVWMRLWHIRREKTSRGLVFVMVWGIPMLAMLCFLEPRQPHFLLPLFPAFALAITYLLFDDDLADTHEDSYFASMSLPVIMIGGLLAVLPRLTRIDFMPEWLWQLPPWVGIVLALIGVMLAWLPGSRISLRMTNMAVMGVMTIVIATLAAGWQLNEIMSVDKLAAELSRAEQEGRPVAVVGEYQGQYHFAARLQNRFDQLTAADVINWANKYPNGLLLAFNDQWQQQGNLTAPAPVYRGMHGNQTVMIWQVGTVGLSFSE